jgi:hypothetical protein
MAIISRGLMFQESATESGMVALLVSLAQTPIKWQVVFLEVVPLSMLVCGGR